MSAEITPAMVAELVQRLRREYPASMYSRVRGHAFVGSHAWATLDLWDTLDALESCRTELEQARIELEDERERVNVQREDIRTLRDELARLHAGAVEVPRDLFNEVRQFLARQERTDEVLRLWKALDARLSPSSKPSADVVVVPREEWEATSRDSKQLKDCLQEFERLKDATMKDEKIPFPARVRTELGIREHCRAPDH